ncbi:MAG: Oxaloacetate decarboxylase, gamma chain [Bacteroidetes bacterium ADurb.Bin217]|nr:MAG: Oxaloacetate decarboxylase, gamma chain [Bacteroidetes bacterium ADurb.Bin217]
MELALLLLLVGMLTVMVALFLVVGVGNMMIRFANKFLPAEVVTKAKKSVPNARTTIPANTMAAIVSAVSTVTQGKGTVVNVQKV